MIPLEQLGKGWTDPETGFISAKPTQLILRVFKTGWLLRKSGLVSGKLDSHYRAWEKGILCREDVARMVINALLRP